MGERISGVFYDATGKGKRTLVHAALTDCISANSVAELLHFKHAVLSFE